ncbi:hypothetical protein PAPYR_8014 [Paratrimastix pyriformis]|uniref:Uncharacterized protein n=1 Tax=Paratrimastix pyriformis TaxID=342808 RepID=A0ABQ8UG89_9EUKA|nr:hypothetical protein PAPYR_8014 [Paratrimastix pyriformis]
MRLNLVWGLGSRLSDMEACVRLDQLDRRLQHAAQPYRLALLSAQQEALQTFKEASATEAPQPRLAPKDAPLEEADETADEEKEEVVFEYQKLYSRRLHDPLFLFQSNVPVFNSYMELSPDADSLMLMNTDKLPTYGYHRRGSTPDADGLPLLLRLLNDPNMVNLKTLMLHPSCRVSAYIQALLLPVHTGKLRRLRALQLPPGMGFYEDHSGCSFKALMEALRGLVHMSFVAPRLEWQPAPDPGYAPSPPPIIHARLRSLSLDGYQVQVMQGALGAARLPRLEHLTIHLKASACSPGSLFDLLNASWASTSMPALRRLTILDVPLDRAGECASPAAPGGMGFAFFPPVMTPPEHLFQALAAMQSCLRTPSVRDPMPSLIQMVERLEIAAAVDLTLPELNLGLPHWLTMFYRLAPSDIGFLRMFHLVGFPRWIQEQMGPEAEKVKDEVATVWTETFM